MSNGARIAIAVVAVFFAGGFALMARDAGRPEWAWVPSAFCLLLALACMRGKIGGFALRIVAACICLTYTIRLGYEAITGKPLGGRGEPDLEQAIKGFVVWGLPFGYLSIFGLYPPWARFGRNFGKKAIGSSPEAKNDEIP